MARPQKRTVDYFPHHCSHGKTMFIIEQKFGNDGYAFWFKLLEMLGRNDGHVIDVRNEAEWEYLISVTRVDDQTCEDILNLLAKLQAIDPELCENRIIWCQNFVDGIKDAYRYRTSETPIRPSIPYKKPTSTGVSDIRNPETKVKETKVKKSKVPPPIAPPEKIKFGEFVSLPQDEHNTLVERYGQGDTARMIDILDNYKGARGKRYKSDYRAILSWVVARLEEEREKRSALQDASGQRVPRAYAGLMEMRREIEKNEREGSAQSRRDSSC